MDGGLARLVEGLLCGGGAGAHGEDVGVPIEDAAHLAIRACKRAADEPDPALSRRVGEHAQGPAQRSSRRFWAPISICYIDFGQ